MTWFNREQLETALKAGRISAAENTISHFDKWLYATEQVFRLPSQRRRLPQHRPGLKFLKTIRFNGPSKELKNLDKALRAWVFANFESKEMETDLLETLSVTGNSTIGSLSILSISISNTITCLERYYKQQSNLSSQAAETALFVGMYKKYCELSGKKGLSDNGPAIRFIAESASILDIEIPRGLRRRIQQAIVAREKNTRRPPPSIDVSMLFAELLFFSGGEHPQN
jgi:hypothetical protein